MNNDIFFNFEKIFLQYTYPLNNEKGLQNAIFKAFLNEGVTIKKEVKLSQADIVDFMLDDLAIEIKIKGSAKSIYKQCERYCQHEKVKAILLVTNKAINLPNTINGKKTKVINIGEQCL